MSDNQDRRNVSDIRCCEDGIARRDFVKRCGLSAVAAGLADLPVMAGPFDDNEYRAAIPIDKKLDPDWVRSLYARGKKQVYSNADALQNIGMPIGGLFAGTVYLGGDGRLWLWEIFNRDQEGISPRPLKTPPPNASRDAPLVASMVRGGLNYLEPARPTSPFEQSFSIRVAGQTRQLNRSGFAHITFDGRYPIGHVTYRDAACPVEVTLEAFSPFIPNNVDDSSLPATILSYTVRNTQDKATDVELFGTLQNPVCLDHDNPRAGRLRNRVVTDDGLSAVVCLAEAIKIEEPADAREDLVFESFEESTYKGWTVEGEAFGVGPVTRTEIPAYQGDVSGRGERVVNSHASADGQDVAAKDAKLGTLTSRPFTIERRFIQLFVGGGSHATETCVNLLLDGKVVASVTGQNRNMMARAEMDVGKFAGREARLQIVDQASGSWGNIGVDQIVFTDHPLPAPDLGQRHDFGTMSLALLGKTDGDSVLASVANDGDGDDTDNDNDAEIASRLVGQARRALTLKPGEQAVITFVVAWHFPNLTVREMPERRVGNHYAARFTSALDVVRYIANDFERLATTTRTWVDTWYDSSLPYWLLDRTMANTSTLATTTCYRFRDGRFWAWEGIGCCAGTCTHVWHYAQAVGRLFPEVERDQRERVDFGLALHNDGIIGHRAFLDGSSGPAVDGQCGRILGAYREHQMSSDSNFLKRVWPAVRKALDWLITQDANLDGVLEGEQQNTLDAAWYGKISWISSLYLAALRAGERMAAEMGDSTFAMKCDRIAKRGSQAIIDTYNGEYFIQIEDSKHSDSIASGVGCHIDQVFGQTWAHWVGLGRLFEREKQLSALHSLWKYNFVPDVGPFRETFQRGRWYATAGDAGLIMCSWPNGGQRTNAKSHWQYGYFNECMSGFEWQAAAHMIYEGRDQPDLLQNGLAISRAIHDRYNAALRNPYNEIECSDHYSRAMASYGVFLAVCGFEHHGPKGHLSFSPRLTPENFRAAFTAANSWGTFTQQRNAQQQIEILAVRYGRLKLRTLSFELAQGSTASSIQVSTDGVTRPAAMTMNGNRVDVRLANTAIVSAGETMRIVITNR